MSEPLSHVEGIIVAEAVESAVRLSLSKPTATYGDAARAAHDAVLDALAAIRAPA
ncbi:MAG TPA: hypothetical protein VK631_23835 [Solirubrobacteraceae bacterium]|nr:hypothetical protein [Solirubrobacteraceae bacterium]